MFPLFKDRKPKSVLREEAVAVMQQARGLLGKVVEHTQALSGLFSEEVKEYTVHQIQRLVMVLVSCVLLLGAYFVLCALLAVVLSPYIGLAWALLVVLLLNLMIAVTLLLAVKKMSGKQLAPATVAEIKNDWQCLKLLCKENSKL